MNPKSIKEVVVYPIDSPSTMADFVMNDGGSPPTWQSRPICPVVETAVLDQVIKQMCMCTYSCPSLCDWVLNFNVHTNIFDTLPPKIYLKLPETFLRCLQ